MTDKDQPPKPRLKWNEIRVGPYGETEWSAWVSDVSDQLTVKRLWQNKGEPQRYETAGACLADESFGSVEEAMVAAEASVERTARSALADLGVPVPDVEKLCKLWRGRAESLRKTVYSNTDAGGSRKEFDMESLSVAEAYDACAYELERDARNAGVREPEIEF